MTDQPTPPSSLRRPISCAFCGTIGNLAELLVEPLRPLDDVLTFSWEPSTPNVVGLEFRKSSVRWTVQLAHLITGQRDAVRQLGAVSGREQAFIAPLHRYFDLPGGVQRHEIVFRGAGDSVAAVQVLTADLVRAVNDIAVQRNKLPQATQ